MHTIPALRLLVSAVVAVGLGVVWFSGYGHGEPKPLPTGQKAERTPTMVYGPASSCTPCHESTKEGYKNWPLPLLCRCDEYTRWKKGDKHADAYNVLREKKARRMGEILNIKVDEHESCLSCHAVVIKDETVKKTSELIQFRLNEGISCVICHGPYAEWVSLHGLQQNLPKWRPTDKDQERLTRARKETEFGMKDLWDPVKRATLCSSCHIGCVEDGKPVKFITHEMYAAGHPPLPGFELSYYCEKMPRHWELLRDKVPAVRKELDFKDEEREQTKLVLVGAATSLAESMRLLARQCEQAAQSRQGLDLANYDCYACHHDLKSESWRRKYGFAGTPGRVPMRPWPTVLVRLAIEHAADNRAQSERMTAELEARLQKVRDGFDARPFGATTQIKHAADALAEWADKLAKQVNNKLCDEAAARKLIAQVLSLCQNGVPDYDSARQIAWAFKVIYEELGDKPDAEVKRALDSLGRQVKLDLPAGRGKSEEQRENESRDGRKALNDYDPEAFMIALKDLSNRLGKK
jgi:hypothetical protein